ncbi:MAG: sigma-70 family RNA polymerase sigma factor [Kiritimatiellia bacterium]
MDKTEKESASPVSVEVPDADLVARAQTGDAAAFEALIGRWHEKIYSLVYGMTSNREDAQDILQEVFIKAYRSIGRFRGTASFYTWIYRIAVNHTINYRKKRTRQAALSLNEMDDSIEKDPVFERLQVSHGPRHEVSVSELHEKLNKALQTLSDKHRTVVVMHDMEGVPHEEIAKMLRCSTGTVRSRLFYARRLLQQELKDYVP